MQCREVPENKGRADTRARTWIAAAHHRSRCVPGGVEPRDDGTVSAHDARMLVSHQTSCCANIARVNRHRIKRPLLDRPKVAVWLDGRIAMSQVESAAAAPEIRVGPLSAKL